MASRDSSLTAACPSLEELIRAGAGAVSFFRRLHLFAHLLRCSACRMEMRHIESVLEVVRSEDEHGFGPPDEDGPAPSHMEFLVRLRAQERALPQETRQRAARRWLPVAAMVPLVIVAILLSRSHVAVLHADELLRHAAEEERARPSGTVQKYRLQLTPSNLDGRRSVSTIAMFREVSDSTRASHALGSELSPALERALAEYPFDWCHPLSVKQFQIWRGRQNGAGEEIARTRQGLVLRTRVAAGLLRVVELVVRADSYHPVRLTLEFEGLGRFDVEEMSFWVQRGPVPSGQAKEAPGLRGLPDADTLDAGELDVRLALQRVGLGPGRSIRLTRTADQVRVAGSVPSARVRGQLLELLSHTPYVTASWEIRRDEAPRAGPVVGEGMSRWLAEAFADDASRTRFVRDLDERLAAVDLHLASLDDLSRRYPLSATRRLSPQTRAKLERLANGQVEALSKELLGLRNQLTALVGSTTRTAMTGASSVNWRNVASRARPHHAALEERIRAMVTRQVPIGDSDDVDLMAVRSAFNGLWEVTTEGL